MKHKIHIVHQTPGRIRVKVPAARGNAALLDGIRQTFLTIPGVEEISVNPTTGSVVLYYDQRGQTELHGHLAQHYAAPNGPRPTTEIDNLAHKIEEEAEFLASHSHLARSIVDFCKTADRQLRLSSNNLVDLKIFIAVGLVAVTFLEVGASAATPMWVTLAIFALNHYMEMQPAAPRAVG